MAVLVYIHQECEEDARKQGCLNDVIRLKDAILKDQRTTLFDNFPPPYLKKRFARQQRLIAADKKVGDHVVVCFLKLLIRGGLEYTSFIKNPKGFGDSHFLPLLNGINLEEWIAKQLETSPPPEKPIPSSEESRFLWSVFEDEINLANETIIYESEDWVNAVAQHDFSYRLVQVPPLILKVLSNSDDSNDIAYLEESGLRIVFRHFRERNKLFLFDLTNTNKNINISDYKNRYPTLCMPESQTSDELIIRQSLRGYPSLLLVEDKSWIGIQQDREANLALSPEETAVLVSAHNFEEEDSGFPLFINGRAGSGKSTILQYLFSDYLRCWLNIKDDMVEPPLYLTYSGDLVTRSRTVVRSLLKSGFKKSISNNNYTENDIERVVPISIRAFKEYLLGLLPPDIKSNLFQDEKYVDFITFRNLWVEKFGRVREAKWYGADICWHVIRTYIKGLSIDGYLDLSTYEELPEGEKSVSSETYAWVFDNVWNKWYLNECTESDKKTPRYWDDQDLVRYILEHDLAVPVVPVIFCDEAQDFTRVEQEFLLRISLFSNRRLNSIELNRVPFAFAGDPFQTLNPTGFRWESIKSSFVNKFVYSILPSDRYGATELNYRELSYNYRSLKDIVYLCNSIQLLRSVIFNYPEISPQDTWKSSHNSQLPVFFLNSDKSISRYIGEQTDLRIVVPCGEGEEKSFFEKDNFLKDAIPVENNVPRNIVSPTRVKGLEFNRVIVYGFGEYFLELFGDGVRDFSALIEKIRKMEDTDKMLPIEYFINWLYVATSRPKKRLFIIDSEKGINVFWDFTKIENHSSTLLSMVKHADLWEDKLGLMQPGSDRSWGEEREDPRDVARKYQQDGMDRKDPYFLRQAASLYKRVQDITEYHKCLGYAFQYERNYVECGKEFYSAGMYAQSLTSFWHGAYYDKIAEFFSNSVTGLETRLEVRFSILIKSSLIPQEIKNFINQWLYLINSTTAYNDLIDTNWSTAITNLRDKIKDFPVKEENTTEWSFIWKGLMQLMHKKLFIPSEVLTEFAYRANEYRTVVELGVEKFPNYGKAKFLYLSKLELADISPVDANFLGEYYFKDSLYEKSWPLFVKSQNIHGLEKCLSLILLTKNIDRQSLLLKFNNLLSVLVFHKEWKKSLLLVKDSVLSDQVNQTLNINLNQYEQICNALFVESLAESPLLSVAEIEDKSMISDFLFEKYIKNSPRGWQSFIHPIVLGTAIEKCGRYSDALDFYEKMIRIEKDEIMVVEYEKRWIVNKFNMAKWVEKTDKENAERHKEEAKSRLKSINMKRDDIPDFPKTFPYIKYRYSDEILSKTTSKFIISTTEKIHEKSIRSRIFNSVKTYRLGAISIKYSAEKQRINLEHNDTLSTAVIDIASALGRSDDFKIENIQHSIYFTEWAIEADLSKIQKKTITFKIEGGSELAIFL